MASVRKRTWTHAGEIKSAWQVSYTDPLSGRRATRQFEKKKEAEAFRIKTEGEIASGERSQLIRASVAEVAERFIRFQEMRMRDGLIGPERHGNVCRQIDFHIKPHLGKQIFCTLTAEEIERWLKVIAGKGLAAGT